MRSSVCQAGAGWYGFTLLEAIVSLVLVASIAAATLELQMQGTLAREKASDSMRHAQGVESLFTMLVERVLDPPELDLGTGRPTWKGTHIGKPYTITREPVLVENPIKRTIPEQAEELAVTVAVYRYEVEYAGDTMEFLWHE